MIRPFGPSRIRNCRYFPDAETAERAARLGVVVNTQPAWYYKDGDALLRAPGASRIDSFIGLKAWQRAGVKVAINSDHMQGFDPTAPLNPYHPFLAMYIAISRKTESVAVIGAGHRVSREDALRMMTVDAAGLSFDESTSCVAVSSGQTEASAIKGGSNERYGSDAADGVVLSSV